MRATSSRQDASDNGGHRDPSESGVSPSLTLQTEPGFTTNLIGLLQ
jgi:hypothetical protein